MLRVPKLHAAAFAAMTLAGAAPAQETFRCTSPDGRVTYQQTPCPKSSDERKVDTTPANTTIDLGSREELLKKGDEAGKRLQARAAEEEAERKRRAAEDERREKEAREREEAREPIYLYAPPGLRPPYPYPPRPPRPPGPTPAPRAK